MLFRSYITMILKKLAQTKELSCVFKGGTSLSKCFQCINRYSEDIDITFAEHLGTARRKRLKYKVLGPIAEELGMEIKNWNSIESNRDYNAYFFSYNPISEYADDVIKPEVKLETSLISYAFPTEIRSVENLSHDFLRIKNQKLSHEFGLEPFEMRVQSVSRTFIDKIFALCDYYMEGKSKRYSRHLYDLYKLRPLITVDEGFEELISQVREHRSRLPVCPSAKPDVDVGKKIHEFCDNDFYKADYRSVTDYFTAEEVSYEDTIQNIEEIADELFC